VATPNDRTVGSADWSGLSSPTAGGRQWSVADGGAGSGDAADGGAVHGEAEKVHAGVAGVEALGGVVGLGDRHRGVVDQLRAALLGAPSRSCLSSSVQAEASTQYRNPRRLWPADASRMIPTAWSSTEAPSGMDTHPPPIDSTTMSATNATT
jgi:hypothetical protein